MSLLTDENIDEIATIAVRTNNREVESTTNIPVLRDRLRETKLSLTNLTKAIESGLAPEALVKRMVELEKEQKVIEAELKNEEKDVVHLEKAQVVYWLEQFKQGDIDDDDFRRLLIDLFVHSVTVWDEEDDHFKITIGYNLTSLENKTYRLTKGGTSSDFALNPPVRAGRWGRACFRSPPRTGGQGAPAASSWTCRHTAPHSQTGAEAPGQYAATGVFRSF